MARLDGTFDATTVPERDEFTPIPPGSYVAMVVASELKPTSKGGEMIVLELDIMEGDHAGRKLFERLNIKNDNPKAVDIAFRTLGEIVKAVGKTTIKDTEELHNKRMYIEVRVDPPQEYTDKNGVKQDGKPQNSIKKFLPMSSTARTATQTKPVQQTASSASSNGEEVTPKTVESSKDESALPPWKRKKA